MLSLWIGWKLCSASWGLVGLLLATEADILLDCL
jgi:hypothetical protein